MNVQFFSPNNQFTFNNVVFVLLDGLEGKLMVLENHAPYLMYMLPGIVTIKMNNQKEKKIVVENGILNVVNNNCNIVTSRVQVFDNRVHNERLLNTKRRNMQLEYITD